MSKDNIVCQECGHAAVCFSLKGVEKVAVCAKHSQPLVEKGHSTYSIDAFSFISVPEDVPLFEVRKAKVRKGMCNLALWEQHCDRQYRLALQSLDRSADHAISVLRRSFAELKIALTEVHLETRSKLAAKALAFSHFTTTKEAALEIDEELLCTDLDFEPSFFRVAVADLTVPLATVVKKHVVTAGCQFDTMVGCVGKDNRESAVRELLSDAKHRAKEGEVEFALDFEACAKRLDPTVSSTHVAHALQRRQRYIDRETVELFPLTATEAEVRCAADACFQDGIEDSAGCRYTESLHRLQAAWKLLSHLDPSARQLVPIGRSLSEVLCYRFSRYDDSLSVIRHCLELESRYDSLSDDAIALRALTAAVYDFQGNFALGESLGKLTFQLFAEGAVSADRIWECAFFLCRALIQQFEVEEAREVIEICSKKVEIRDEKLAKLLKMILEAWVLMQDMGFQNSESMRFQARKYANDHFPGSIWAVFNLCDWASMLHCEDFSLMQKAKSLRQEAHGLLSTHFPLSRYTKDNLFWLQRLCEPGDKEVEKVRKQLIRKLQSEHPAEVATAQHLIALAHVKYDQGKLHKAVELREAANYILTEHHRDHPATAQNLTCLGDLYYTLGHCQTAKYRYTESQQLHDSLSPHSNDSAFNLFRLALAERKVGSKEEARSAAVRATAIWTGNQCSMAKSHGEPLVEYLSSAVVLFPFTSIN